MRLRFASSGWMRYGFSILAVILATLLRLALHGFFRDGVAFITFYPAVALTALFAGARAGIFATILSALAADIWIIQPYGLFSIGGVADALAIGLFAFSGILISTIAARLSMAREREAIAVERLRGAEGLRLSEERLSHAQEMAHLGNWELDLVGNHLTWSDEVYRIFGFIPQKFGATYEAFLNAVHPDDRAEVDAAYTRSIREGKDTYEIEHRVVRKDTGEIRVVHEKCEHFRDSAGKIIRSVGMVLDITERKRSEEALQKAHDHLEVLVQKRTAELKQTANALDVEQRRFHDVLDALPAYVALLTTDYRVAFANRYFEERFGKSNGNRCYEYLFKRAEPCENCETFKVLETQASHRWEWKGPDGCIYDVNDFPFQEVGGATLILEMGIDITARKQAEAALLEAKETLENRVVERTVELAENESRLRLLAHTSAALLKSDSPQDIVNHLCREVMDFLECQIFFNFLVDESSGRLRLNACAGLPADETRKIEWLDFGAAVCGCVAQSGQRIVAENIQETPDPRTDLVKSYGIQAYACHPLIAQGKVLGTLSFGTRIRSRFEEDQVALMKAVADLVAIAMQRKQTEQALHQHREHLEELVRERTQELSVKTEQLYQAQKLEAIGRLAGGVAHDFNNLMMVVVGYTDRLLRQPGMDPQWHNALEQVQKAGERAVALTRQLLTFSRKQAYFPQLLNLNTVIKDFTPMLSPLLREDIQIRTELSPDRTLIFADINQIGQVLLNLGTNARDAMSYGGQLIIRTNFIRLDHHLHGITADVPPGNYVVLTVMDNGRGMNEEVISHVFEPFFTTKGQGEGTGLGLATVYGIIKQMNGYILVDSVPGQGTTFRVFFLEVSAAEPVDVKKPVAVIPTEPNNQGKETILLVEDEELVRQLTAVSLREMGYTVLETADGKQALRVAGEYDGSIQLIVTDVVLPGFSGPKVFAKLKEQRPDLNVLYISGYPDKHLTPLQGVPALGVAFLQKPFDVDDLARKVREVLDSPRPVPIPEDCKQ